MATTAITYKLASDAGLRTSIVRMGFNNYDPVSLLYKEDFPDMELTRPGAEDSLATIESSFLVTVNGYVYSTAYSEGRLYVPNATKSLLKSRANAVGLLNLGGFSSQIKKLPITPSMVTADLNMMAYEKVFITFNEPVKYPLLVMAGYIIPYNSEYFYRVSDNAFALCLNKLQYSEKLYELSRYRHIFEDLQVDVSPLNPEMVDANVVRSENTIRKFLTLSNSFMVDLNSDTFNTRKVYLEHSTIPGTFRTELAPNLPLVVGYGKLSEYAITNTGTKYSISTQDAHYNNHLLSYMPQRQLNVMNDHRKPGTTYALTEAFFLEMKP